MKRNLIAAILLTAAVAFSCTTKEEKSASLVGDGSIVYNPTASIKGFVLDGAATKTVLTIDATTGANFTFAEGDALGVYPYSPELGTQVGFTVTSVDAESCTFNGGGFGLKSGQLYAVYYPYSEAGNVDDPTEENINNVIKALPVDYTGQRQTSADGTTFDISKADYLVDNGVTPVGNACEFEMKHVGALIVLDVTFPQEGSYTELTLTSDGAPFTTTGTLDLTASEIAVETEGVASSVTLALGEEGGNGLSIAANQTVRFCMMVAPVDLSAATVTLSVKNSANEVLSKAITSKNIEAGKAYRFRCKLAASSDEPEPTEPTDLSEDGTANTYIVSAAGDYYFDATVAGNGVTPRPAGIMAAIGFNNTYPDQTTGAVTGSGVELNWAQDDCISDVYYEDGYIHFTASGAEGNAKVTLKNGNSNVWTWLIWCTDQPSEVTIPTSDGTKNYAILDRNIGAISSQPGSTEAEYGLYYMFGDPIGYTVAEWQNGNTGGNQMVDELTTPTFPYCQTGGGVIWFNQWAASANPRQANCFLWGAYGTGAGQTWGSTFDSQPGTSSFKQLYDPCPVGYKVMSYDVLDGYFNTDSDDRFSANEHGTVIQGSNASVFFPYNGYVFAGGYIYTWAFHGPYDPTEPDGYAWYVGLWTSAANSNNMAWSYQIYAKSSTRAGGGTGINSGSGNNMGRGLGVRCMVE